MSVVTIPEVVENITESCEIDRTEAWEIYKEWEADQHDLNNLAAELAVIV